MKRWHKKIGVGGMVVSPYARKLINQVLDSGRISYGPMLKRFEEEFAELCGREFAISASSGTSALRVALQALKEHDGWKDGDEVLVPAITFIATSNVVIQNNLKPIFVDVDPKLYTMDPADLKKRITKRTRAIMPVHLCGVSADMTAILKIARAHKLRVVEDSCETVGVTYRSKPVGSLGDIACFSTYMAHIVTTGVGGLALTDDPALAVRMRSLINHGRDSIYVSIDDDKGLRGKKRFEVANKRFSFVSIGYSDRMTEFEGALGLAQLRELPKNIKIRQRHADTLIKKLSPYADFIQLPTWPKHAGHAFIFFPIIVRHEAPFSRDELIEYLEDHNVETRYLMPLLSQPVYVERFGNLLPKYPNAARIDRQGFYVGCHPEMGRDEIKYIGNVFGDFFEGKRT